jgi:hypothetical protein
MVTGITHDGWLPSFQVEWLSFRLGLRLGSHLSDIAILP